MNYRSVVILGKAALVDDPEERLTALRVLSEHILPGRWDDDPQPARGRRVGAGPDAMNDAPQQIEAQIAASRAEMGAILDRIERKLVPTPRQLLHRGVDMLKDRRSASIGVESEGLKPSRCLIFGMLCSPNRPPAGRRRAKVIIKCAACPAWRGRQPGPGGP